ncbi:MAG: GNAT family N-acetyltransferase [Chloroflexi bacterium]|nr:GNAT family N-acetyltransferase [Chloroflexota bacterium]MBT4073647.1 GNAT family N-acetyltransferase [Chloroflexota bacterium]MBT4515391.1 GNAT family N-acetyltransferase [Chloroflexota bacterium]MBT5320027.1 GNAT family N-acetyltransferase [Chloroflexota bacterium]MBT6682102.1 GNAT family N-acetyltransferase [Chloroflexota bacterium]
MQIKTQRLVLREFVQADWPDVLRYQSDPRYLRYYPWSDRTEDDVRDFVDSQIAHQSESPRRKFQLVITLPDQPGLIGNCGIRRKSDNDFEADIGYELSPERWGRGYATEAASAMVDFGFQELGLNRVSSWSIADNAGSANVLEKVGLKLEGRLRSNEYFKGRWWDTLLHGMLRDEWTGPGSIQSLSVGQP